ncbi:beta-N-acetylglucosaminidase domain-containing protein [Streptomyces sp. NPDC051940]|uniref:beta-N-acetylglucosaminidase domain-containing protein n=1 Tax=Streptomyces sp. NPDC051940 TaxID=3155675 RepID=UPI003449D903
MHRTALAALLVLAFGLSLTPSAASGAPPGGSPPPITPAPRSAEPRTDTVTVTSTVDLVAGPDADAPAVRAVEDALYAAGADTVRRTATAAGGDRLAVYLDGAGSALDALGIPGHAGLPAEGYVLGAGKAAGDTAGRIALDGVDATGTFYAAQSLRQLLPHRSDPGARVGGIAVRDWPGTAWRGVIEGFYGIPWSHESRLDQLDFYGAHKMNIYVYSPKDDPYLREKWRDAYPAAELATLKELVDRARANHVEFTYALSPGLSVCYSSDADIAALNNKFQTLWDIGVRTFAVPLDDISYTSWNCPADQTAFGTGGGAAGKAQSHLLNRVNREFIATHEGASPLQMVPTEYYNVSPSPYKQALKDLLDPDVLVEWTGIGVIAPTMTVAQAQSARSVFGHEILTWDNYPVNDYVQHRLLLGPFTGREKGLPGALAGITANPMNQAAASKLALYTVADYAWNDGAYDPRASWEGALKELSGGDTKAEAALRAFADVNYSSRLEKQEAPELSAAVAAYWAGGAASALDARLRELQAAPGVLRERLPERALVEESAPWLDATADWARAMRTALSAVEAARSGDAATAWRLRQQVPGLVASARAHVYVGLGGSRVQVAVGEGVFDTFVAKALAEHNRLLGVRGRPTAFSSLGVYSGNAVSRMADGDDSTFYWSDSSVRTGSYVGIDLGSVQDVSGVRLAMGKSSSPNDYMHQGVLEVSDDGSNWTALTAFSGTAEVTATAPAGTKARYVRARATASQDYWLVVREFAVTGGDTATVAGGPPGALAAAADGNPDSAYTGARAPEPGEALTVSFATPRAASEVVVLRPESGVAAQADVEVRVAGEWRPLGALTGAYSALPTGGVQTDAVRLRWREGTEVPAVAEVIVR